MISELLITPTDLIARITTAARNKRLALDLSQVSLSQRSGVSLGVLKRFERTGKISFESLLKLAMALGCLADFMPLFQDLLPKNPITLDDLFQVKTRKRGRK